MSKYTKGRWEVNFKRDGINNEGVMPNFICSITSENDGWFVALIHDSASSNELEGETEGFANAKLIAAAPDLLESLQGILAITDRNHIAWDKARKAIDKATK